MVVADQQPSSSIPPAAEQQPPKPLEEENEPALPPPYIDSNPPSHMDTLLNESAPVVPLPAYSPFAVVPERSSEPPTLDPKDSIADTSSIEDFPPFRLVPPSDSLDHSPASLKRTEEVRHPEETEPETMQSEFATVADALESLTPHHPEAVCEESENEASPKKRPSVKPRPQKRSRASSLKGGEEDAEPAKATGKKRRTLPLEEESSFVVPPASSALVEMTLHDVPEGWRLPLVYFVTEQQHESWGRAWKQLPDRRVSTGAVYLSPQCSGTPEAQSHAEGPTCILRDLCALLQEPSDEHPLHERSYVSLSRASVRETISFNARNSQSFEFGVTKLIKASAEREYLQPVPLDVVCEMLVSQLRAMLSHTQRFPSHLFALDLHVWQYAPTVCLHTRMAGLRPGLASLLEAFASETGQRLLMDLAKVFQVRIAGSRAGGGSRRRNDRAVGTNLTYTMGAEEIKLVEDLCDDIEAQLKKLRVNWVPKVDAELAPPQSYAPGDIIVKDLPVMCLPRSSAALRDRIARKLGAEPLQIPFVESMIDETSAANFKSLVNHLLREDNKWLNNFQHALFLDMTLSSTQEEWIMSNERIFDDHACPETDRDLAFIQAAIRNAGVIAEDTASSIADSMGMADSVGVADPTVNVKLLVNVPESKIFQDVCSVHKVTVSLVATQEISTSDTLRLGKRWSAVTWADLIADEPVSEGFVPNME